MSKEKNKSLLVGGNIPAGKACPFIKDCPGKSARCPSEDNLKEVDYSCAAARAFDMINTNPYQK